MEKVRTYVSYAKRPRDIDTLRKNIMGNKKPEPPTTIHWHCHADNCLPHFSILTVERFLISHITTICSCFLLLLLLLPLTLIPTVRIICLSFNSCCCFHSSKHTSLSKSRLNYRAREIVAKPRFKSTSQYLVNITCLC